MSPPAHDGDSDGDGDDRQVTRPDGADGEHSAADTAAGAATDAASIAATSSATETAATAAVDAPAAIAAPAAPARETGAQDTLAASTHEMPDSNWEPMRSPSCGGRVQDGETWGARDGPRRRRQSGLSADPEVQQSSTTVEVPVAYRPVRVSKETWQAPDSVKSREMSHKPTSKVPLQDAAGLQKISMPPGIFTPYGRWRRKWDFYIILLVTYSATVSVFIHSFVLVIRLNEPTFWIENFIDLSFFIDLLLWFRTAYVTDDKNLETDKKKIAVHYLSTWFAVDAISMFPWDLVAYFIQGNAEPGWLQLPRLLRLFRFLKIVSVLKVLRIHRNVTRLEIRLRVKYGYLRMVWLLLIVVLIIHWGACLFYLSGKLSGPREHSWILQDGIPSSVFGQYIAALYFATYTITTTGYGDVTPTNTGERIYNICLMLVGAITYAYLITQVAETVEDLTGVSTKYRREMDGLTSFAASNNLPFDLSFDLRRYFQHRANYRNPSDYQDLLNAMSADLRTKVMSHLYKGSLENSNLLRGISEKKREGIYVRMVSGLASPGEALFLEGDPCDGIFVILHGSIYLTDAEGNGTMLGPGSVFGEDEILFNRRRRASATASNYCDFAKLSREAVVSILSRDEKALCDLVQEKTSELWCKVLSRAENDARFWAAVRSLRVKRSRQARLLQLTPDGESGSSTSSSTDWRRGMGETALSSTYGFNLDVAPQIAAEAGGVESSKHGSTLHHMLLPQDDVDGLLDDSKIFDLLDRNDGGMDSSDSPGIGDEAYDVGDIRLAKSLTRTELERAFLSRGRLVLRYKSELKFRVGYPGSSKLQHRRKSVKRLRRYPDSL